MQTDSDNWKKILHVDTKQERGKIFGSYKCYSLIGCLGKCQNNMAFIIAYLSLINLNLNKQVP